MTAPTCYRRSRTNRLRDQAGRWSLPRRADGLPAFWIQQPPEQALPLKYAGIPAAAAVRQFDVALRREAPRDSQLSVLVFGDPQVKSLADVGYYARDIIDDVQQRSAFAYAKDALGISLGDIANDDLSLYPALNAETTRLGVPWLHAAGNHDLDFDAARDEDSLLSFRNAYGPDSFAWENRKRPSWCWTM